MRLLSSVLQVTTADYVDLVGGKIDMKMFEDGSVQLVGTVANSLYKILRSNDDTTWHEEVSEATLTSGTDLGHSLTSGFRYYKIQIKVSGSGGKVKAHFALR